jgi:hypothetical protein
MWTLYVSEGRKRVREAKKCLVLLIIFNPEESYHAEFNRTFATSDGKSRHVLVYQGFVFFWTLLMFNFLLPDVNSYLSGINRVEFVSRLRMLAEVLTATPAGYKAHYAAVLQPNL